MVLVLINDESFLHRLSPAEEVCTMKVKKQLSAMSFGSEMIAILE